MFVGVWTRLWRPEADVTDHKGQTDVGEGVEFSPLQTNQAQITLSASRWLVELSLWVEPGTQEAREQVWDQSSHRCGENCFHTEQAFPAAWRPMV